MGVHSDDLLLKSSLQGQKYRHPLKAAHFLQNYDHNSLFPSDPSICVQPDLCSRIQKNSRGRKAHLLLYLCFMHKERNFQSDRYKISLRFMATSPHEYSQRRKPRGLTSGPICAIALNSCFHSFFQQFHVLNTIVSQLCVLSGLPVVFLSGSTAALFPGENLILKSYQGPC